MYVWGSTYSKILLFSELGLKGTSIKYKYNLGWDSPQCVQLEYIIFIKNISYVELFCKAESDSITWQSNSSAAFKSFSRKEKLLSITQWEVHYNVNYGELFMNLEGNSKDMGLGLKGKPLHRPTTGGALHNAFCINGAHCSYALRWAESGKPGVLSPPLMNCVTLGSYLLSIFKFLIY